MKLRAEELKFMAEGMDAAATYAEIPDQRLALMFACGHYRRSTPPFVRPLIPAKWCSGWDAKKNRLGVSYVSGGHGVNDSAAPRTRYGRPASHSASRSARSFPAGSTPYYWTPSYAALYRRCGPTLAGPMSPVAISPRKRSFWPGSWPSCCGRSRRR